MTKAKPKPAARKKTPAPRPSQKLAAVEVVRLPLGKVKPNPDNPRTSDDPEIPGLMDSIKANGLINPIIVRATKNLFEIVAGHRRFEAHKRLKLPTIDAIVNPAAGAQEVAERISAVENLQRRSLTLQEEAGVVRNLASQSLPLKEIADALGRPIGWVTRRLRIMKLIPAWVKLMGKPPVRDWAPRMIELVASLDESGQKALLEDLEYEIDDGNLHVDELERAVGKLARRIDAAPFEVKDGALVKGAPECGACLKRASCNPGLFDKVGEAPLGKIPSGDRCLDPVCWDGKAAAQLKRSAELVAAGQNAGDKVLVVSKNEGYGREEKPASLGENVAMVQRHHDTRLMPMKPGEKAPKNARLAVDAKTGRPAWLIVKPEAKAAAKLPGEKKTLAEQRAELDARRQASVNDQLRDKLEEFHLTNEFKKLGGPTGIEPIAARLVAVFGTSENEDIEGEVRGLKMRELPHEAHRNGFLTTQKAWEQSEDAGARGMMLWFGVREVLRNRLKYFKPRAASAAEAEFIAGIFSIDLAPLRAKATADNPVPKSWPAEPVQGKLIKPAKKKKGGEAAAPAAPEEPRCRECGCTEDNCERCIRTTGEPCSWTGPDLCSRCAKEKEGVA
jgi:ParB/RepB/Spo0J family partition protein